ncbi:MAG: signal peptidase I [Firmicutes bacterium]|nr:signal peptidase I [Bacillota bacterium]
MNKIKENIKELLPYIIVIMIVLAIKAFVVAPIRVNGPSMEDTLYNGDIMILDEISYRFNKIERFDIVVVKYENEYLIKRVIGLPGERVEYKNNKLYINGKYVQEKFSHEITDDFKSITIPNNKYFVLGDNRINSTDSRIIGFISKNNIRGKTSLVLYPFNRFGSKK